MMVSRTPPSFSPPPSVDSARDADGKVKLRVAEIVRSVLRRVIAIGHRVFVRDAPRASKRRGHKTVVVAVAASEHIVFARVVHRLDDARVYLSHAFVVLFVVPTGDVAALLLLLHLLHGGKVTVQVHAHLWIVAMRDAMLG